jgi:predicted enzyme related to lactoylglutathione lyase
LLALAISPAGWCSAAERRYAADSDVGRHLTSIILWRVAFVVSRWLDVDVRDLTEGDTLASPPDRATGGGRRAVDWTLEVVILPVSDIDRSIEFYRDKVGFELDHDTRTDQMHVVQLTPRGSGCSIVFGDLPSQREMAPGSMHGHQLVVADAEAARRELLDRGVDCSEITVFDPRDGGTFFSFSDPYGNTWAVQQLKVRAEKPLIPVEPRGRFGA